MNEDRMLISNSLHRPFSPTRLSPHDGASVTALHVEAAASSPMSQHLAQGRENQ